MKKLAPLALIGLGLWLLVGCFKVRYGIIFGIIGPVILGLIGLAVVFTRSSRKRELGLGIWIGLGIGALVEGLCFTIGGRG